DFNIDILSREIGLGRTNLFAKIKGITGQTPNNFIMNTKLKRGMLLLTSTNMDIAEIAYELGFNSPSYFIKVFKDLFGATPASFRKKGLN
ncbi:MAG: AraC family transcriptional regulator, partial [Oscillospiraceae bacterium]